MRKKLLSVCFSLLMFACACPLVAQTHSVSAADELAAIAVQSATTDFEGQTIELNADIDLSAYIHWTPIGSKDKPFKGTFRGNGHMIKGLRFFEGTDGVGLFGHVGEGAVIEKTGIQGGPIIAKTKRRIGAIAGVCDGTIRECWSMALIDDAGNVCGGLVGELTEHGLIEDCYHSGLIHNASDTIGGIVGRNSKGRLNRVMNFGYAKDGNAIVGDDKNGTYTEVYFDRKLYWQASGVIGNTIIPFDETKPMFSLFDGRSQWSQSSKRYPVLSAFENTDAAKLSAAPMYIESQSIEPVNHANALTLSFEVSIEGGIQWECQDPSKAQWVAFDNMSGNVTVVRPCAPTEVLVNSTLNNETRVVLLDLIPHKDLLPGTFITYDDETGEKDVILGYCYNSKAFMYTESEHELAKDGWIEGGNYHYKVDLFMIDDSTGDTIFLRSMLDDATPEQYEHWFDTCKVPTKESGHFIMRSYVHDEGCVTDWVENKTGFEFFVLGEFHPGKIVTARDTFLLTTSPILVNAQSESESTGGAEDQISYQWVVEINGQRTYIEGQTGLNLVDYPITEPGVYKFYRSTSDDECYTPLSSLDYLGVYTVWVFAEFDPGEIVNHEYLIFCTMAEAKNHIIEATAATGGVYTKGYSYQWYLLNGSTETILSGATAQNLALGNLDLTAGYDYTFIRKAKDNTDFTDWTLSRYSQTIHIMPELLPGAIKGGELEKICIEHDAPATTSIHVTIPQSAPASGDEDIEYQWIRTPGNVVVGTEASLDYSFQIGDIALNRTYTYTRQVRNPGCGWIDSEGQATQYYGRSTYTEIVTTICESDLPYQMTVDGQTHTFYSLTDVWTVTDQSGECPVVTVYKLNAVSAPTFNIASEVSWCQTTGTMTIYFEQTSGMPNIFHITYSDDLAVYMGAKDTTGIITTPGTIVFKHVPNLGEGDKYLYVQIGYRSNTSEGVCFSAKHKMNLYPSLGGYVYSKYDRVVFVDNNPLNGALPSTTEKLEFVEYQWYKNGIEQPGQTGQYYHEGGSILYGVFYAMLKSTDGRIYRTCDIELPAEGASAAPQFSAVYPVPVGSGEPLTIEGMGQMNIYSSTGECVARMENVDGKAVISAPYMTGIYYVQITNAEGVMETHKLIVK